MEKLSKVHPFPWALALVFFGLAIGIGIAGHVLYSNQKEEIVTDAHSNIAAIANIKAQEILYWRRQRLADARVIQQDFSFSRDINIFLTNTSDEEARQQILSFMTSYQKSYDYRSIILLDNEKTVALSVGDETGLIGHNAIDLADEAFKSGKIIFSDLQMGQIKQVVRLDIFVPMTLMQGSGRNIAGMIILRIDPHHYLYPLLQEWPASSKSGETILIRREGNEIVFLNELRHRKGAALTFRLPITTTRLPAAMAAAGKEGIVEGIDYRGENVLAAIKPVADSPWYIIAKRDTKEVYAMLQERLSMIVAIVIVLVLFAGAAVGYIWRRQQSQAYRQHYEMELERVALTQHYMHLTRYANDIILMKDEDGKIVEANERASETYGYTPDELFGMNIRNISNAPLAPDSDDGAKHTTIENGTIYETNHRKKDGTLFPVEVSARTISIEGRTFYQGIIRDITQRKRIEEEIRLHRHHLEELVEERTRELEEANLHLQELDQLKSMFIASMSHELRTPLNSIIGFTGIILMGMSGQITDVQKKQLAMVSGSAHHLLDLINDVIDVSKIETGKVDIACEAFDLAALAQEVTESFAVVAANKGVPIALKTDGETTLTSDRRRVRQILINLVGNAMKFTEKGIVDIAISKIDGKIEVKVSDTGVGMTREGMAHLFNPFYKVRMKDRPIVEGTGLGLYLTKRIVELLGGEIRVASEFGKGSEFAVALPLAYQGERE